MNSETKRQTLPSFARPIPALWFWPAAVLLPAAYMLTLSVWSWPIFVAQYLFFLLPCSFLLWHFGIQNAFFKRQYAFRFVLVLVMATLLTLFNNTVVDAFCQSLWPMPQELQAAIDTLFHREWRFGLAYDIFQVALVPAMAEELLFRGFLLTVMLRKMPVWAAVLLNGFLFALYHLNPWQFVGLFLLGTAFAAIFVKTRNLTLVMLAHFVNNLIGVLTWWFWEKH